MTESRDGSPRIDQPSDEQTHGRKEWHAPSLAALGDARTLTEAGGVNIPDGGGNNAS